MRRFISWCAVSAESLVTKDNYDLFYKEACGSHVPIVLVVTGLENEEPMENWWKENCDELLKYGLEFEDHACITATRGKVRGNGVQIFDKEYEESRKEVKSLIERSWRVTGEQLGNEFDSRTPDARAR